MNYIFIIRKTLEFFDINLMLLRLIREEHIYITSNIDILFIENGEFVLLPVPLCRSDDSRTRCLVDSFLRPTHKNYKYYLPYHKRSPRFK